MMSKEQKNIHLLRTEDNIEAEMVQSLLEVNGVFSLKKARYFPGPSIGITSAHGSPFGIDIYIMEKDKEKAEKIIEKENIGNLKEVDVKKENWQNYEKKRNKIRLIFGIIAVIFFVIPIVLVFSVNLYHLFLYLFT